jgi:hypothetical protein
MRIACPAHPFGDPRVGGSLLSADAERDAPPRADPLPRTMSGGLALPPRQLPPAAPRTVALEAPLDPLTRIVHGIADVFGAIRRAAAEFGIS